LRFDHRSAGFANAALN